MKLKISSGAHLRRSCPVFAALDSAPAGPVALRTPSGELLPAQYSAADGGIWFLLPFLSAHEELTLELVPAEDAAPACASVIAGERVSITLDGRERCGYFFGTEVAKPYLGPFFERYGGQITRLDPTVREHPHHRCFWFSHGSVNGVDTWNEPPTCGYIRNREITPPENGGVYTGFLAHNVWTNHEGEPLCEDETSIRFYRTAPELTVADVSLMLIASHGEVVLGRTKEAGPVAVRMSDALTVKTGTGTFVNGAGGVNEDEIWMKRAPWCDYYGQMEGHSCGFAILDNPQNEGFPSYWHARNYGLMAPNNFHIPGDRVIPAGERMTFRYRLVSHNGTAEEAGIAARFADYAYPPKAEWIEE